MNTNLKAFMKDEVKNLGTIEFPGIEKFTDKDGKPIPFILRRLSLKEVNEIRNHYRTKEVYRDKQNGGRPVVMANGQVAVIDNYDANSAGLEIMVEAFVQPKLDDPELMEFYGVYDRLDMPQTIFCDRDDFQYADKCVMEACGLVSKKDDKEVTDEIKN